MKKVEAWKCDWCSKASMNPGAMANHEASCLDNPAKRACKTCKHSGFKIIEHHHTDAVLGINPVIDWDEKRLWCFEFDMAMEEKPYYSECGDDPEPFTCQHYEYKGANKDA